MRELILCDQFSIDLALGEVKHKKNNKSNLLKVNQVWIQDKKKGNFCFCGMLCLLSLIDSSLPHWLTSHSHEHNNFGS
jgi:hypothetical protein